MSKALDKSPMHPSTGSGRNTGYYPRWSVVLPVYNQADHLRQVVAGYRQILTGLGDSYELLLVPNGCRDESERICDELAGSHDDVVRVHCPGSGWGRGVLAGVAASRGDVVCYTNLARTAPEDLLSILLHAKAHPDLVVKANRTVRESLRRRVGSLLYNLECRLLFGLKIRDINGTPKVFPRRFAALLELSSTDDLIDAEFALICRRRGYPVVEVPIGSSRRHGGSSTTSIRSALRMYLGALALRRRVGGASG